MLPLASNQAMNSVVWRTDWLATRPVFYNTRSKKISHNVNDVTDFDEIAFHPEGFNNYLDWGFSILEQTPLANVKFLPPNAELQVTTAGELEIRHLDDPVEDFIDYRLSESDIIDLVQEKLVRWQNSIEGSILLPLSGGFDSRLLAYLLPDKSRIQAYSYGVSPKQAESYDVVYARDLCKKLGIEWKHIQLGKFHQYFDEWNQVYGISSHSHGMYHIEFYRQIFQLPEFNSQNLLSGIIGVWNGYAGKHRPAMQKAEDLLFIRQTNTHHGDSQFSKIKAGADLKEAYFQRYKHKINDERFRIVECKRFLMHYISYLLRIPESMGMPAWSPYLEVDVAMAMMNLPEERRVNKLWVDEFFDKVGVGFSQLSSPIRHKNTLNYQALQTIKPPPLTVANFGSLVSPDYVRWINRSLEQHRPIDNYLWTLIGLPKINRLFKMVNIWDQRKIAYAAYLTLKPFEYLFNRRQP